MTEFNFGINCTFCQSRIGSTHCLLPYQLVVGYHPPQDFTSKVIDITEIHMRYGLEMLQTNSESIKWIRARPGSSQSLHFSMSDRQDSNQWSDQMNSINDTVATNATSVSIAVADSISGSDYSDFITRQLDENECKSEDDDGAPLKCASPIIEAASTSDTVPTFVSEPVSYVTVAKQESKVDSTVKRTSETSVLEKYDTELSRENRNHLIGDLVMMAKTAFNLHACKRDWIKVDALKESIMYESDLRSKMNAKYNPSTATALDGNKAFAKEIIATHGSEEIQQWESGKFTSHGSFCLLNCKFATLKHDDDDDSRLCEELIKSFHSITRVQQCNKSYIDAVIEAVKFELSKDGHSSTLDWMRNRTKFLGAKTVSRSSTPSDVSAKGDIVKKQPYPATDERLLNFMNTHLQVYVNREIEAADDEVPKMVGEIKLTKFMFKLASEFLLRNKGWHNENSFTSPQHLVKLEEFTGLKSQPSEASMTFSILKKAIDNFRMAFKERHPKASTK